MIFIMADDLGYGDLGCYGQTLIKTRNIDRLAAEGIRFTQAYAGSTVCAPSRGILVTGLHNGHAPVRDNVPHYHTYLQDRDITLAEVLKQAGYYCEGIGKWSLGDPGTEGCPTNQGFDGWLGYLNQDHAHYFYPAYLDEGEGRRERPGNSKSKVHYSHDLMTEWALRFIRDWDYGHCRARDDQAVRVGPWKGIRHGMENAIQIFNLDLDVQEKLNVADQHPAIVKKIAEIMQTAAIPSERYPIGKVYQGKPIWKPTWTHE